MQGLADARVDLGKGVVICSTAPVDKLAPGNALFPKGEVDLAFICTGPYAASRDKYGFDAIATPQVRGQPFYQSYLIVPK